VRRLHPLIEEAVVATVCLTLLSALIASVFWAATGASPWPVVVLAEVVAMTWGVILLIIASPSRGH
jgi:hypothetical protein